MNRLIIFLFALVAQKGFCQEYTAQTSIQQVEHDGFYRILLTPELATHLGSKFTNVRIADAAGNEIPYIFETETTNKQVNTFEEYVIKERIQLKDSCTILVLSNPFQTNINNISLVIKNAEVLKTATLAGSDDMQTWFALKEKFTLSYINSSNATSEIKIVDFPLSNYPYYRLYISDKESSPINVIKAGYYKST